MFPWLLLLALVFVLTAVAFAQRRGVFAVTSDSPLGLTVRVAPWAFGFLGWLGLSGSMFERARRWVERILGSTIGYFLVLAVTVGVGATLFARAQQLEDVVFRCENPSRGVQAFVGHRHVPDICASSVVVDRDDRIFAMASGHRDLRATVLDDARTDDGNRVFTVRMTRLPDPPPPKPWHCSATQPLIDDHIPMACGPRSRATTWDIDLRAHTAQVVYGRHRFEARTRLPSAAVALDAGQDCYVEDAARKQAHVDSFALDPECERSAGVFNFRVTVCDSLQQDDRLPSLPEMFIYDQDAGRSELHCDS